jgi:hypothetical protein
MQVIKIDSWDEIPKNYTGITEWPNGTKVWCLNGKQHREDGPAVEHADGAKEWYLNDKRHREDGPAIERADGGKLWYLNDEFLFWLPRESQPFVLLEEFIDEKGNERIKVLTQEGTKIWPILPGLRELADNWENPSSNMIAT